MIVLELHYAGGDRLFLPVENIELLSRYGSEDTEAQLDKLGGVAWQARKARLKERILEIADDLIKTAAARAVRKAPSIAPTEGLYDEFSASFPLRRNGRSGGGHRCRVRGPVGRPAHGIG